MINIFKKPQSESKEKKMPKENKKKNKRNLVDMLNEALSGELQAIIQYMWQHIVLVGKDSAAVSPIFKKIAIEEMKHAEMIAERLNYLGGDPTTKPSPIKVGHGLEEMLRQDATDEENTISFYKEIIAKADESKDYVTKLLFANILTDEENHHDQFTRLIN